MVPVNENPTNTLIFVFFTGRPRFKRSHHHRHHLPTHQHPSTASTTTSGVTMEAPLVCLDEEFEDLRPCRMEDPGDDHDHDHDRDHDSSCDSSTCSVFVAPPLVPIAREDFSELENFSEMMSFKSMEDLVNEFDEKLNVCFHNYNTKTECLAPIRSQAHTQEDEERLQDEE